MMEHIDTTDVYYTAQEVADRLKVSRSTIYRLEKRGEIPKALRLSRTILRWSKRAIDNLIETESSNVEISISRRHPVLGGHFQS